MKKIFYFCFMTKMFAIKLLVEYARTHGQEPHNDLVMFVEDDKEWDAWQLKEFIIEQRNSKKTGRVGKAGSNKSRRFRKL